ncbi:MAG TPA: sialidase family protein, partial [Acidimicrobiales bacterium]|nr:sialidase family protein [Acidimicrobiales bacterium]
STLYYGLVGWDDSDGGQRGNISVLLARSTDLGETWESTVVRNARGLVDAAVENNTPVSSVVVDTTSGPEDIVYVAWRRSNPNATPAPHRPPMVAVSIDGGKSFGEPIEVISFYKQTVKNPANGQDVAIGMAFNAPVAAVDDKGTLYVLYPANAVATITPPQPFPVLLAKSTDRGKSFTFTEAAPPSLYTEHVVMMKWTKHGGPEGTLHIVYEDKPDQPAKSADRDIYYTRSTDGGQTFSPPKLLNDDDPSKLAVQATPNLSVADNGRVDAVWWDFRDDAGRFANDVYYSYSEDNGLTWSRNIRISDRSVNRKIGVWSNGADIRQPPGVASTDKLAIIGWDDTRLGDDTTHTQDIFTRVVQFEALGGSNDLARYAIGAIAGLAVVGIVLLVISAVGGRRRGSPVTAGTERQQTRV